MRVTFHHRGRQATVRFDAAPRPSVLPLWDLLLSTSVLPAPARARARVVGHARAPFSLFIHGRPVLFSKASSCASKKTPADTTPWSWVLAALPAGAPQNHIDVRVRIRGALRGGKGGFGAQLKALGKAGGGRKTRNFGACRDLNGRRLRHVNDAMRLKLWRESRQAAEAEARSSSSSSSSTASAGTNNDAPPSSFAYRDGQTMSGISGWHLTTPSWADGVKTGKLLSQNKRTFYNAQRATDSEAVNASKRKRARIDRVNEYASLGSGGSSSSSGGGGGGGGGNDGGDSIMSAVEAGLKKEKKMKSNSAATASTAYASSAAKMTGLIDPVLTCLRGTIGVGSAGEAMGESNFGSVGVAWAHLESGCWFFEAELTSDGGVVQVGWATTRFLGDNANGDGVGDDAHSWGYDGHRGMRWHGGGEMGDRDRSFGGERRTKEGDVLGCMFDFDQECISYWLNGQPLGVAFRLNGDAASSLRHAGVYPAVSLEADQSVRFNLGQRPFRFPPTLSSSSESVSPTWTPVWEARPRFESAHEQEFSSKATAKGPRGNSSSSSKQNTGAKTHPTNAAAPKPTTLPPMTTTVATNHFTHRANTVPP